MPAPKDPKKREDWITKLRVSGKKFNEEHPNFYKEVQNRPEVREKSRATRIGKHHTEETKAKMCASQRKRFENPEEREELCAAQKIAHRRPEYRARQSAIMKIVANRPEVKAKKSVSVKELWQDPEYKERRLKAIFGGRKLLPNKPEKFLIEFLQKIFPNQWKYVGSGNFIIEGTNKNPDFIHINQKKIIEMFGDYWHGEKRTGISNEQHEQERIDHFAKYGYQTLIIWEHELEDINILQDKLLVFMEK